MHSVSCPLEPMCNIHLAQQSQWVNQIRSGSIEQDIKCMCVRARACVCVCVCVRVCVCVKLLDIQAMCTYTTDSLLQYIWAVNGIAVIYLNNSLQWSCQDTQYTVLSDGHTGCSDSWWIDRNCYTCLRTTQPDKLHTGHIECISSTYSLELEIITVTWLVLGYMIFGYRLQLLLLLQLNPDGLKKKEGFFFCIIIPAKGHGFCRAKWMMCSEKMMLCIHDRTCWCCWVDLLLTSWACLRWVRLTT